jgi:hypothetical protein
MIIINVGLTIIFSLIIFFGEVVFLMIRIYLEQRVSDTLMIMSMIRIYLEQRVSDTLMIMSMIRISFEQIFDTLMIMSKLVIQCKINLFVIQMG